MDQTLFYALGIALVLTALSVSAVGLRSKAFPSGPLFTLTLLVFVALVLGTATFAVLNSQTEAKKREEKLAREEAAGGKTPIPGGGEVPSADAAQFGVTTASTGAPSGS